MEMIIDTCAWGVFGVCQPSTATDSLCLGVLQALMALCRTTTQRGMSTRKGPSTAVCKQAPRSSTASLCS